MKCAHTYHIQFVQTRQKHTLTHLVLLLLVLAEALLDDSFASPPPSIVISQRVYTLAPQSSLLPLATPS